MAARMIRDEYGRVRISEEDICALLYHDPDRNLSNMCLDNPDRHNAAIDRNYSELGKIAALEILSIPPQEWHKQNQSHWHMPDEYKDMDIAKWLLDQCNGNETELQRCGMELLEYTERGLLPLLAYLKYLVDTMRENSIVWGVGRGSSVASFVLYKIGIHRINSIEHDLDFHEFMR